MQNKIEEDYGMIDECNEENFNLRQEVEELNNNREILLEEKEKNE